MPEVKSPLMAKPEDLEIKPVEYTPEENEYIGNLMSRLWRSKQDNDRVRPEFGGKTRVQYYAENERIANTQTEKKEFDDGIIIGSGTVEQKLYAVAAEINRLNLSPEVRVFDKEDYELVELGMALTDLIHKTEEWEGDAENKLLRQVELFKQGTVFIQENWVKEFSTKKKVNKKFAGAIKDIEWTASQEKCYEGPRRQILYGPGVYLGSMREYNMNRQPFVFTHKLTSYSEARSRYEKWDRWKHVPRNRVPLLTEDSLTTVNVSGGFSLVDLQNETVEEVHYQDKFNNEYQIFLNGIAMLPIGFPLTEISPSGEYNIEKQVFQAINPFFPLGRSFVAKTANLSDLLDEMLRLLILKTRKSIHPPYANISGRVISSKVLSPGRITMGIDPGALVKIGDEGQGATAAEYQMMRTLQDNIDRVTVSPQFQGHQGKSGTTAYEVGVLQAQADKVMSLSVFANSLLEQKISYLRLYNILGNYFTPTETVLDQAKNLVVNRYRVASRAVNIEGRGKGTRRIIPIDDNLPDAKSIYLQEEYSDVPPVADGQTRMRSRTELGLPPVQNIFLNPKEIQATKLLFHIEVDAHPKDTSDNAKNAFRSQLQDIQALMAIGSRPNVSEIESDYARVWGKKRDKIFADPAPIETQDPAMLDRVLSSNRNGVSTVAPQDVAV